MFRLLHWPSAIGGDKFLAEDVKTIPSCAPAVHMNGISLPPMLKRKRSNSSATDAPAPTKARLDEAARPAQTQQIPQTQQIQGAISAPSVAPSAASAEIAAAPTPVVPAQSPAVAIPTTNSTDSESLPQSQSETKPAPAQAVRAKPDRNTIRDTITSQISLEILLKHNELRLIDQEIAKCQIALEQLRRCAEIPYPGSSVTGPSLDVSSGVGAAVLQPGNGVPPLSPAPWGVTEGPYSRHYKQWLLPDPRFDGGEAVVDRPQGRGRSTRAHPGEYADSQLAGTFRPSRSTTGGKMLGANQPPKDKAGSILIRRKSDGQMVKLVCMDCQRENFSSPQGFINHCRIAHRRSFDSHQDAAIACGIVVDVDEAGGVVAERSEPPSASMTPGTVHPFIRSAQLPPPPPPPAKSHKKKAAPGKSVQFNSDVVQSPPAAIKTEANPQPRRPSESVKATPNPAFQASPLAPHLSALMRDRGSGLNLNQMVGEAKEKVDLTGLTPSESSDSEDSTEAKEENNESEDDKGAAGLPTRMPTSQTASERTESRKGLARASPKSPSLHTIKTETTTSARAQSPQPTSHSTLIPFPADSSRDGEPLDHAAQFSPQTVHSNQAPSLVSDDEDDYDEAAYDSDGPSSSESGDQDQDRHIEVADDERNTTQSTAPADPKARKGLKNPAPQAPISKPLKRSHSKMSMMGMDSDEGENPLKRSRTGTPMLPLDFEEDEPRRSRHGSDEGEKRTPPVQDAAMKPTQQEPSP
ncbi:hypothetical protein N7532_006066 [Penicillium argentinense]|uniref:AHC1-like C2H2 zinc-finger domain-containing protein n=1 Tax=Penicillium argentinense TaxID=1131581 RepID=A0A9W9FF42_9EURO|nr:uncharacterized protein N7532_006066 [Penicillium argentinense]KAJ5099065.1 hypothetical protein N7532_006066 [Penicillium argentinense]